jgi:hypothetical protein
VKALFLKYMQKPTKGGKREGSGRPKGIETKILTIRVAAAIHDEVKALVKRKDAEYRQNK